MWVKVSTPELKRNISVPVSLGFVGTVVRLVPDSVLARSRENVPEELQSLLTRQTLCGLLGELGHTLKRYKGLEIVHVESGDGTRVSVRV